MNNTRKQLHITLKADSRDHVRRSAVVERSGAKLILWIFNLTSLAVSKFSAFYFLIAY